ncbi:hypothetical protein ACVOMS_16755 [Bradyrhizobium guangxiense]
MTKAVITAVVMLACVPASAVAQERAGDAALGAVSGAVVLGPVGAVAGALIGYTAGPSIARSWGVRGSRSAGHRSSPRRAAARLAAHASGHGGQRPDESCRQSGSAGSSRARRAGAERDAARPRLRLTPRLQPDARL